MPAPSALPEAIQRPTGANRFSFNASNRSYRLPIANLRPRKVKTAENNRYYGNGVVKKIHFRGPRMPPAGVQSPEYKTSLPWLQPTNLVKVHSQTVESEPTDSNLVSLGRSLARSLDRLSIFKASDVQEAKSSDYPSALDTIHNCTLFFEVSKNKQQFTVYLVLQFRKKAAFVLANYCLSNDELARYLLQKLVKQEILEELRSLEQKCHHLLTLMHILCYINDLEIAIE